MTLGGVEVVDLSRILGGDGICGVRLWGGLPLGVCGPLPCRSWIALLMSLRFAWWSTNRRLRSSMAAVSLPVLLPTYLKGVSFACSCWPGILAGMPPVLSGRPLTLFRRPSSAALWRRSVCRRWLLLPSLSPPLSLSLSSLSEVLPEELRLVEYLLSAVGSTLLWLCFVAVATATRNAIRAAAAVNSRKGDNPCCAPQSTLQRQGSGFIWEWYSLCSVWNMLFLGYRCGDGMLLPPRPLGRVWYLRLTGA